MKLSKDKTALVVNEFADPGRHPARELFDYRLGNRSALEWVIDQYQVSTDKRSGITSDPNRADDPEYIVRLVGQVVTVSVETVKIVKKSAAPRVEEVNLRGLECRLAEKAQRKSRWSVHPPFRWRFLAPQGCLPAARFTGPGFPGRSRTTVCPDSF